MTVKRRKKVTKYRGSKTHGGGAMKKRRGAGNRGGRGMAGTGKRGDARKPSIWTQKHYFGKHGFKKKNKKTVNAINLKTVEERTDYWAGKKLVEVKKDIYYVDLKKLGYNKLIGSGDVTRKINILVEKATDGAVEKIKKAGGNVEITVKIEKELPENKEEQQEKPEQEK